MFPKYCFTAVLYYICYIFILIKILQQIYMPVFKYIIKFLNYEWEKIDIINIKIVIIFLFDDFHHKIFNNFSINDTLYLFCKKCLIILL